MCEPPEGQRLLSMDAYSRGSSEAWNDESMDNFSRRSTWALGLVIAGTLIACGDSGSTDGGGGSGGGGGTDDPIVGPNAPHYQEAAEATNDAKAGGEVTM